MAKKPNRDKGNHNMRTKSPYLLGLFSLIIFSLFLVSSSKAETVPLSAQNELINIGNGRWSWQHPQPQGNELQAIECPTEEICYSGGRLGYYDSSSNNRAFVLQTKDGTETWSGRELAGHGINQFHCVSANTCYTASFFGHVLKTTNGGQTWATLTTNTDKNLWGIYCFNGNNCLVVGESGTIQETTNGGQTWVTRTSNTFLALNDITCINSSVCLIVGGSGMYGTGDPIILRSQNGGDSWQTIATQASNILNAIDCFDSNTCVAVGWAGVIQVTENAGLSWRSASAHTTGILKDIECPTAEKCFLVSYDGQIYVSEDGFIWLEVDIQNDISLFGISCPSSQQCTAVGDNGHLIITTNGGRDWHKNTQGILTSTTLWICYDIYCHIEYTNRINDLECFSDGRCLAVGLEGRYLLGDALYASWTSHKLNTSQNLRGLSCYEGLTTTTCYAAGSGGTIWKSTNRGASWQTTTTGVAYRFYDIDCPAGNTCIAVGEDGAAIRTTNGGASWQTVSSTTTNPLYSVDCPSTTKCVAVGGLGEIIYSNNGGQTWQRSTHVPEVSTRGELLGIHCLSANECLAVGNNFGDTLLFRSYNGGGNWNSVDINTTLGLRDIACTSDEFCTAVGSMGSIFRSENGGDTWQEESSGTSQTLLTVSCLADGSCFAAGEQGNILGAAVWPNISVTHSFVGTSFADSTPITGKIEVVNQGNAPAPQIQITNNLPSSLIPNGPATVSWGNESTTINSPTWPNLLAGLNITLTTGSTLSIEFPLLVENPQQLVQKVESNVEVTATGMPKALAVQESITLSQHALFAPVVSTSSPDACYGPYIDNFTSNASGWPSGNTGGTTYGYQSGEYSILHQPAGKWFAVTRRDLWQSDLLLKLRGYQLANNGFWGLLFGLNDNWSDFYTFEILPNYQEWYVFNFNAATGWTQVASGSNNNILSGQGKNNLLIQGANNKMYFYVNNYLVYEMAEKPGFTGLTGGSFSTNTHLRYDDYLFHQQGCSVVGFQLDGSEQFPNILIQEHRLLSQIDN